MFGGHWIDQGWWWSWRGCRSDSGSQLHDLASSGVDAMCVGGNSRSDAIRVKGMIACNYRRMPIRGPFGDRCGKHGPPRPIVSMVTLQVRNEHKVFGNMSQMMVRRS